MFIQLRGAALPVADLPGDESVTAAAGKPASIGLPEVDDEVLVGFTHGDPRNPYLLGSLWNSNDTPPETAAQGSSTWPLAQRRTA